MEALLRSQDSCGTALARDAKSRTPLIAAAAHGHADVVALLLAAAPEGAILCNANGRSALHHAVAHRHWEAVQALLQGPEPGSAHELDPESETWCATPLHWAVLHGCCEADVRSVLAADPGAALELDEGPSPLQVRSQCVSCCDLPTLLQSVAGLSIMVLLSLFAQGLVPACHCPGVHPTCCAFPSAQPRSHLTSPPCALPPSSLQLAIQAGRMDLVQLLIPASNLTEVPSNGCTPLHTAVRCRWEAAAQLLLQAAPEAAAIDSDDELEFTPLCEAAAAGCTAIVQLILEAAPEAATSWSGKDADWLPMFAAAEEGHAAVVQLLLAAAPDTATAATQEVPLCGPPSGSTPLHLAAEHGDVSTVQLLLAATAPTAALKLDGLSRTPAYCALVNRNTAALAILLQAAPAAASFLDIDDQVGMPGGVLICSRACRCPGDAACSRWPLAFRPHVLSHQAGAVLHATYCSQHLAAVGRPTLSQMLIHVALELDCVEAIAAILAAAPDTISEADGEGRLPLNSAIEFGQLGAMQAILAAVPAAASLVSRRAGLSCCTPRLC